METRNKNRITKIVRQKEPPSETATLKKKTEISFWENKNADEIAKEQGIGPIQDVNDLFGYWPADADFDSFYNAAVNSRKHAE